MVISTDPFSDGLYWAFYKYMESNLIDYMKNVPYIKDHEKVHSPPLLAQLLQICGYIDSAFKDMARYTGFATESACQELIRKANRLTYDIRDARKAFQPIYHLSEKRVIAKLDWCGDRKITPFGKFHRTNEVSPTWWKAHQEAKHSWTTAFKEANLKNTLEALSAAFLMNGVHFPSIKVLFDLELYVPGVLQTNGFFPSHLDTRTFDGLLTEACTTHKDIRYDLKLETPLFIYVNKRPEP
jgi:hypothetical protein